MKQTNIKIKPSLQKQYALAVANIKRLESQPTLTPKERSELNRWEWEKNWIEYESNPNNQ